MAPAALFVFGFATIRSTRFIAAGQPVSAGKYRQRLRLTQPVGQL
jgi:hypothetical protein